MHREVLFLLLVFFINPIVIVIAHINVERKWITIDCVEYRYKKYLHFEKINLGKVSWTSWIIRNMGIIIIIVVIVIAILYS